MMEADKVWVDELANTSTSESEVKNINLLNLINPHLIKPVRQRIDNPHFSGGKRYYILFFPLVTLRSFRTATEADAYGARVHARWCRLYDAAIASQIAG